MRVTPASAIVVSALLAATATDAFAPPRSPSPVVAVVSSPSRIAYRPTAACRTTAPTAILRMASSAASTDVSEESAVSSKDKEKEEEEGEDEDQED